MQKVDLYRYEDSNALVITPNKRNETDNPSRMRLIADDGAVLTNGDTETAVVDVTLDEIELWQEIGSGDEATTEDLYTALAELGVE